MAVKAKVADVTATKVKVVGTPFKSGSEWNGNAAGRPKGARSKLGQCFLEDMLSAWQTSGKAAIERVIEERPHEFIKAVAGILPKEMEIKTTAVQDLSDDDLAAALIALRSASAFANAGNGSKETARH
jgi:hypothetical protein